MVIQEISGSPYFIRHCVLQLDLFPSKSLHTYVTSLSTMPPSSHRQNTGWKKQFKFIKPWWMVELRLRWLILKIPCYLQQQPFRVITEVIWKSYNTITQTLPMFVIILITKELWLIISMSAVSIHSDFQEAKKQESRLKELMLQKHKKEKNNCE